MGRLDQVFRMRHHAEHIAVFVDDAGNVVDWSRSGLVPFGIAEDDPAFAFEAGERLGIGEIVAVAMGDRAADDLALA